MAAWNEYRQDDDDFADELEERLDAEEELDWERDGADDNEQGVWW